jgi:hypothetical protein
MSISLLELKIKPERRREVDVTCNSQELAEALEAMVALKHIETSSHVSPILEDIGNVRIFCKDEGEAILSSGTPIRSADVKVKLVSAVDTEGLVSIALTPLNKLVHIWHKPEVHILSRQGPSAIEVNTDVEVSTEGSSYWFNSIPTEDLESASPDGKDAIMFFDVSRTSLISALRFVAHAADTPTSTLAYSIEPVGPSGNVALSGVNFNFNSLGGLGADEGTSRIAVLACNGHRLATVSIATEGPIRYVNGTDDSNKEPITNVTISRSAAKCMALFASKLKDDNDADTITIAVSGAKLWAQNRRFNLELSLYKAAYPDVMKVVEAGLTNALHAAIITTKELKEAAASIISAIKSEKVVIPVAVEVSVGDDEVQFKCKANTSDVSTAISATSSPWKYTCKVTASYLHDVAKNMAAYFGEADLTLSTAGKVSPILIRREKDSADAPLAICAIMPRADWV